MSRDYVDICMATYCGEAFLVEQLRSLSSQSFDNWRLLVSDDGSTDQTVNLISSFAKEDKRIFDVSKKKPCRSATDNFIYLLSQTQAPYVMLCDQDDVWNYNKIETTLNKMKEMEALHGKQIPVLVFTDSTVVDENLDTILPSFSDSLPFSPSNITIPELLVSNVVQGCTVMLNRAAVDLANQHTIPPSFKYHDHWLASLVSVVGLIGYVNRSTMLYRQHSKNVVGSDKRLSVREELCNGLKRLFSKSAIADACSFEVAFAFRAYDILGLDLPISDETRMILGLCASFPSSDPFERVHLIKKLALLREVDFYGRVTQLSALLLAPYIKKEA